MRLLAVALLSCSMLAAKPALAQQQVENDQLNLNVITDTNVVIDSSSFSQMNTVSTTIINSSTVSADDFTQSAKISQTNAIAIEATIARDGCSKNGAAHHIPPAKTARNSTHARFIRRRRSVIFITS